MFFLSFFLSSSRADPDPIFLKFGSGSGIFLSGATTSEAKFLVPYCGIYSREVGLASSTITLYPIVDYVQYIP
jgi:hypothetical protein